MSVIAMEAERIKQSVIGCRLCGDFGTKGLCIDQKEIGLKYTYPNTVPINILWVAESPPQPGNGFFYDQSVKVSRFRDALFDYINLSGLGPVYCIKDFNAKGYYLADVINCRWDKNKQSAVSKRVANTCAKYLAEQINLFKPRFIVFMGDVASGSMRNLDVFEAIKQNQTLEGILEMSFIMTTPKETKQERIEKLKKLAKRL